MQTSLKPSGAAAQPLSGEADSLEAGIKDLLAEYAQVRNIYQAAIQVMNVRLETLNNEFLARHLPNPIHSMCSRVKSPQSIMRKLRERNIPISFNNAKKSLRDIAGVRVICCYVDDIYILANLLKKQDDVQLIEEKDYIRQPKANGYRSLHLVMEVPVYLADGKVFIPVEVQIRTVAMDFWASLEHSLHYKAQSEIPDFIVDELKNCADVIASTDARMQEIFKAVNLLRDVTQQD